MRKVANIMMLLNGIFSIIGAGMCVLYGVMFILIGTPLFDVTIKVAAEAAEYIPESIPPEVALNLIRASFIASGAIMILSAVPLGILAKFSFKARQEYTRKNYLTVIIMSAIFTIKFGIVGGIFGLIANRKAPKPQAEAK